jgi:predicted O-linked N-acetylglucosamine transferase (SPINDLY family)
MTWHPNAYQLLIETNYPRVAEIYEELIENDPHNISNYWYLGTVYLLQNLEAEAQVMWQGVFSQGNPEQVKEWEQELETILDTEAKRQQRLGNLQTVELIRYHLQEIIPDSINNLLSLFNLGLDLGLFEPEEILNYSLRENLGNNPDPELLETVVLKTLAYPSELTLDLAQKSLPYLQVLAASFIPSAFSVALNVATTQHSPAFGAEIMKLCLQLSPNDLSLLEQLVNFNILAENFEESLQSAYQLLAVASTLTLKLYSNYVILSILLRWGAWQEIDTIYTAYQSLLQELSGVDRVTLEPIIQSNFLGIPTPLPYLGDRAVENRQLTNRVADIFFEHYGSKHQTIASPQDSPKLTIGYLAHTLRQHSVGWLSRWLLHHHDRDKFQIALYTINQEEDEITRRWFRDPRDLIRHFPSVPSAAEVARQITKDQVDILVDLDSLTHNLTGQIMALKPAPIQVTWLGWDASGLPSIDYYIADPFVLPDRAQDYYREKLYRLPETYLAIDGFEIGVPTLRREDFGLSAEAVIYLSVQSGLKRHPDTIALQMKILKAVPRSYFFIKGVGDSAKIQDLFTDIALREGVDPSRLQFLARDRDEYTHRANLQIADVVLDTYPYNGATTTLEALWQGIPIVTRVGEQFAARNSYTFLINAGIHEGIAWSDEEYVDWGIRLGSDRSLRQTLTTRLLANRQTAPLWQAQKFARQMETAYLKMRG